jgi:hypothetical protein
MGENLPTKQAEVTAEIKESSVQNTSEVKLPKNTKGNRYYYNHREKILERRRLERLAKKGVDISKTEMLPDPAEERRRKKMEHLGLSPV